MRRGAWENRVHRILRRHGGECGGRHMHQNGAFSVRAGASWLMQLLTVGCTQVLLAPGAYARGGRPF